jgi:NADPH:quinone reductase-like Zn-dependent oxidoreductase
MRAVRLHDDGLRVERLIVPTPAAGEALVRVHATAITRHELTWPTDRLPAIPSYELSGVVARVITHVQSAALPMPGLTAWQGLFEHGRLADGERVRVLGQGGGVGHLAVQLARSQLAGDGERCELIFDTVGGAALAAAVGSAPRIVSVAEEAEGVSYFIVEPNREQLLELARLADAGELEPEIDSVFKLEDAPAAFARVSERGKHGKVVLRVAHE